MLISLTDWASRNFSPAPCRQTLYKWVNEGRISPQPKFIGKSYMVDEKAQITGWDKPPRRKAKAGKQRLADRIGT